MKKQLRIFLRTTVLWLVFLLCIIFAALSVCEIYENIRYTVYGEYKNAVELTEDGIRILDFLIG